MTDHEQLIRAAMTRMGELKRVIGAERRRLSSLRSEAQSLDRLIQQLTRLQRNCRTTARWGLVNGGAAHGTKEWSSVSRKLEFEETR